MPLSYQLDPRSCAIGMINCFVEMVECGVKPLAISPPVLPEDLPLMTEASQDICDGFGVRYYVEHALLVTDLQSESFTRGKHSILYYKDQGALDQYFDLKSRAAELERRGAYSGQARRDISVAFGLLLGYPRSVVEEKVQGSYTPYVVGQKG